MNRAEAGTEPSRSAALLSAVIPNYNHARYLPAALDALLAQERPADEILVIDDGSADDSVAVVEAYAARHPAVRLIRNPQNQGVIATLQRGLEAARGRYVYFGAADDQVLPGFFVHALSALARDPSSGLFCADTLIVDGATGRAAGWRPAVRPAQHPRSFTPAEAAALFRRADNFIHTGSAVLRRDLALAKGGFDPRAGSFCDGLLVRRIAFASGFCYAPWPASAWNVHITGVSRTTALDAAKARQALETMAELAAASPELPPWYPPLLRRRWRFATARLALDPLAPNADAAVALGARSRVDRLVLGMLAPRARTALPRLLALAWLTLRLRPYRLRDVLATALVRRWRAHRAADRPPGQGAPVP